MQLSQKIRLLPTKEQESQFYRFSNTARFIYNECLSYRISNYKKYNSNTSVQDCIKHIQELKNTDEYSWIKETPESVTKQAIKDLDRAYINFYRNKNMGFPKFKKKSKDKISFYQRTDKFYQIDNTHIKITGIKTPVKCSRFIIPKKISNPRVSFDGKYWYLSYGHEVDIDTTPNTSEIIGIDLGIKNLAVCSDGKVYENINKSNVVRRLEKRKKFLQRKISKKYLMNKIGNKNIKTNNISKLENKVRLIDRKLKNIRNTYIHTMTKEMVRTKPEIIVIEDLDIRSMLKNKHLSKAVQEQEFFKCRQQLEYKSKLNNINLIIAPKFYPSSKICSHCKTIKKDLELKDRIYKCDNCGFEIDRDLNASINLKQYYEERKSKKTS